MSPVTFAILLFAAGLVLMVIEVLLPAYGLIGIAGVLCLLGGVGVCFWINQWLGVAALAGLGVAAPFGWALWAKIWPHTPIGRRMMLQPVAKSPRPPAVRVGQSGVTVSELRPAGLCEFGAERLEAFSEGAVIPPNTAVRVIGLVDGRAMVRAV